ncbi:hypothetical protein AB0442_02140 [Kitasatospora sp. NPDC085895]|uniref:hypothetical protein n=1 Tax=Kitasatospora sp. NPDC085895 TaxID=3155057 RepID=UPI00344DFEE4
MDSVAMYGLIGAVSAALIGACAAIFGPALLQRQRDRSEKSHGDRAENQAEVRRLINMRTTSRAWHLALQDAVQDLELGRFGDIERFDESVMGLRVAAGIAVDDTMNVGIWQFQGCSARTGGPFVATEQPSDSRQIRLLNALDYATSIVRNCIINGPPIGAVQHARLIEALDSVAVARERLGEFIEGRVRLISGGRFQGL